MPDLTPSSWHRSRGPTLISVASLICCFALSAADPVTDALQQGLLEEEVNRNLPAAIQAYEKAVQSADAQRQTAATALFRLAEGCRRLGRTNDAVAHYRRVVDQFADQATLAAMSRTNLAVLAPSAPTTTQGPTAAPTDPAVVALLREELKLVEQEVLIAQKKMENGKADDTEVRRVQRDLLQLQRKLPENADRDRQVALLQQELGLVEANLTVIRKKIEVGAAPPLDEVAARRELLSVQRELAVAQKGPTPTQSATGRTDVPQTTDAESEELKRLQLIFRNSPDLANARSPKDEGAATPLHLAASRGFLIVAEYLLNNQADVNSKDGSGRTPLHRAARAGHKRMCELLLSKGADLEAGGFTPLHEACSKGYPAVVSALLAAGGKVNLRTSGGTTPLHLAAEGEVPAVVDILLKARADLDAKDVRGDTPLIRAVVKKQDATVKLLLDRGANIDTCNSNGVTALHWAVLNHALEQVELLLGRKAEVNAHDSGGSTPLHYALEVGPPSLVKSLLVAGADPNATGWDGGEETDWPPLLKAADVPDPEFRSATTAMLLDHGADANAKLTDGWTALHMAARNGSLELAKLLVSSNADVNARGAPPRSAPRLGSWRHTWPDDPFRERGYPSALPSRIGIQAPPQLLVSGKSTPLHVAVANEHLELTRYFIDLGAEVDARDDNGRTPLHLAVNRRNLELTRLLLDAKADPNATTLKGETPLRLATQVVVGARPDDASKDIQALLVKYGAQEQTK